MKTAEDSSSPLDVLTCRMIGMCCLICAVPVGKLHPEVPDFKCIPLEQINAFSQFHIVGSVHSCL